ncbi:hypothetical protein [Streptomyces sp. NPDC102437]|uniref:hypothetical protein n=1 Tax=Streptomyces sp. NPDC102437 TaxID=3366175 RepID=UPI0038269912
MSSKTTAATARIMARLVEAEDVLTAARREEARAAGMATRAAARAKAARTVAAMARRELAKVEAAALTNGGKGLLAATRKADTRTRKAEELTAAAGEAKATATIARRAARTAARRVERIARRAALAATRSVEKIAATLGETSLTPAPEADRVLDAAELPAVEEIETHAARYAELDRQAKDTAKLADAEKVWLRQLPNGQYGGVVITRTPGRSVLDGAQVALHYTDLGKVPPRKNTRATFKCDATALLKGRAAEREEAPAVLTIAA